VKQNFINRSATSTAPNVTNSVTDSSSQSQSQSRDVVPKMFSTDETIFEDENAAKTVSGKIPEINLDSGKRSPSLKLQKEPEVEEVSRNPADSGKLKKIPKLPLTGNPY
jgi:hypothetical protein